MVIVFVVEIQTETISVQFVYRIDMGFETKSMSHPFFLEIVESSSRIIS